MVTVSASHDLSKGKLTVDSGATSSVAGPRVCEDFYEYCHQPLGDAESEFQTDESPLMLTVATGLTRSSQSVVNMPCSSGANWRVVPVRVLDAPSRLLLGVDTIHDLELRINFSTSVAQSSCLKQYAHLQSWRTGH